MVHRDGKVQQVTEDHKDRTDQVEIQGHKETQDPQVSWATKKIEPFDSQRVGTMLFICNNAVGCLQQSSPTLHCKLFMQSSNTQNLAQDSHSDWKTWKNGKAFSSQGKVREI